MGIKRIKDTCNLAREMTHSNTFQHFETKYRYHLSTFKKSCIILILPCDFTHNQNQFSAKKKTHTMLKSAIILGLKIAFRIDKVSYYTNQLSN